jgi:GPH family glycoside/pentoside/hexuronide:cation symporter
MEYFGNREFSLLDNTGMNKIMSEGSKVKKDAVDRLPILEKAAFGMRAFSQQVGSNGMTLFAFPAYGMILGMNPAVIGLVFALMRFYDAFTDPLMGWISDNTRSRWGRRRPYIFIGALLGGLTFALLWLPAASWSEVAKTVYFVVLSVLFYTSYTIMSVPAEALGWELTPDYAERTRLMSWFSLGVRVALLILPWMFAWTQSSVWANEQQGLRVVGALFGLVFALTGILPAIFCKERNFEIAKKEGRQKFSETLKLSFSNRTFLLVCAVTLFSIFAGTVYMLFGTHLSVYYLYDGDRAAGGKFFGIFGSAAAIVGVIAIVAINRFFAEVDKKRLLLVSIGVSLAGWLAAIWLITPAFPWLTLIPVCCNSLGVAVFWMLIGSIMADVADEDEFKNGHRREGALAAFLAFLAKAGGTITAVLGGFVLSMTGFDTALDLQNDQTLVGMKILYVGFPLVGYLIAFLFAWRYPLGKERMLEIRTELEARRGPPENQL